ncbi:MAG: cation:proton antiporter [Muribaculaceae bacterium]|nr:cation:proton antiporter [Bacteroides sp.]MDE7495545.1 cation:proton antiporter [Muribaculaceae bacterium]
MTITASIFTFPLAQPVAIFLLVLVIILAGPLLFRPLKIPSLVGFIIAGVVVGPYGFNILARDSSFEIFGQVGILYLMFLAAVEIDMFHLKQNSRKGIMFGLITFAIPMVAGIFGSRLAFATSWTTSVLIAAMYAAHTLVSYPIVSRFGLQDSKASVVAVCGTIVAVLLALVTLAEVVTVADYGRFSIASLLRLVLLTGVYAVVVGWTFPRMTTHFFRRIDDTVSQFIFILAEVLAASMLAQLIGLESILGAFYAGLVLNRYVPGRSALMGRIKFVGNAIFIPYFLIGVGMLINIHVVVRGWNVAWVAANMTVVALGSKWVSAWIAQKMLGMTRVDRNIIFGLSAGKAAATIAAAIIGFQHGMISENVMNGAVVMILACCVVSTIVTESAAKRLRIQLTEAELSQENATIPGEFARQLVAVANPVTAEGLMKMAVFMRHPRNRHPITALYVRRNDDAASVAMGRNALRAAVTAALAVDIEVKDVERYDLNIVAGVKNVVKETGSSDIIIGLHRRSNIVDTFHGQMVEQLLRATDKMIFMSRCFIPVDTVNRIMVSVPRNAEFETGFQAWVERVANLTSQLGCKVIFLAYSATAGFISNIIEEEKYAIRHEYHILECWDDFIIYSAQIDEDDLLMVVSARKGSVSASSDSSDMPTFLARNFSRQNLVVIYPQQFGG